MPKQDPKPATPVPDSPAPVDEFHGQGGSYMIDPVTGVRTRVEEATQGTHVTREKE
jgi:hypothetical protein